MPEEASDGSPWPSPQLLRLYRAARRRRFREEAMLHPATLLLHLLFCLVSPLGALGLALPGLVVTALFAAALSGLVLWGRGDLAGKLLLWWLAWGALVWGGLFLLRLLAAWQGWRKHSVPLPAVEGGTMEERPKATFSPRWQKREGGWGTQAPFLMPARGLCVLELTTEDEEGELSRDIPGLSAWHEEGVRGLRKRYLLFFLLEKGLHRLPLMLLGREDGAPAPEAHLRLLHPPGKEGGGFCHLP